MTTERTIIKTDIYPTRYTAFDNPGSWAVFEEAEDGTYRSCREDGPRVPRSSLGAGVLYPGEMAILSIPVENERFPHLTDGFYVDIGKWPSGFVADCHHTKPTEGREQEGARLTAETLEGAIALADAWIAKRS